MANQMELPQRFHLSNFVKSQRPIPQKYPPLPELAIAIAKKQGLLDAILRVSMNKPIALLIHEKRPRHHEFQKDTSRLAAPVGAP